jgi:hypothetical protein
MCQASDYGTKDEQEIVPASKKCIMQLNITKEFSVMIDDNCKD